MSEVGKSIEELISEIDLVTRARIASLCARGLEDRAVADILFVSAEHVGAVKETVEFKAKYAEEADRIIQDQIDRDEGWDGLETKALESLLEGLRFMKDPKLLLQTAMVANRAERRAKSKRALQGKVVEPIIVDATIVQPSATIIVLNRNYITTRAGDGAIDVSARPKEIPMKQSDIPAPKLVEEILAPARNAAGLVVQKQSPADEELERLFAESGVVFDKRFPDGS